MGSEEGMDSGRAYPAIPDAWNDISGRVIRCAMEVHRVLGPGLLERGYEDALAYELGLNGLAFERQVPVRLRYKKIELPEQRLDLVVEGLLVLELKSIERVADVHLAQLVSYLRSADLPLGLLVNFNVPLLKQGLFRRINPQAAALQRLPSLSSLRSSGPSGASEFLS